MALWDGENIVGVQETDGQRPNAVWGDITFGWSSAVGKTLQCESLSSKRCALKVKAGGSIN